MAGKVVAHYEIVGKLGEGGMGVVWKARDTHLDRFVALKTLSSEGNIPPERLRRFVQEAKAASALNHPNIVHIYDIAEWDGAPYIAMQYAPGRTLEECIGRKGMKLNEVLKYGAEIADAMATAHAAGIVHRDLKPSNIIVTEDGHVKVLDFGLAKLMEQTGSDEFGQTLTLAAAADGTLTQAGAIVGTLAYLSPEQAEGKQVDGRSDIFSFGAVLYEMITGTRAFDRGSRAAIFSAILNEEPKPIRELRSDVPVDLEKLVNRCLRKDPERRLRSMADLALGLRELKEESESGSLGASLGTSAAGLAVKPRRRSVAWAAAGAAVAVMAIAGSLFVRGRQEKVEPVQLVPVTTYAGTQAEPSLSPDGSQVAFAWNGEAQKNFDIYVKAIGPGPPLRITKDDADETNPAWSPDGSTIAFMRQTAPNRYRIMLVPALGGEPRPLTDISIPDRVWLSGPFVAWFPDGQWLAIADALPGQRTTALWAFSPATGERRPLTSPPSGTFGDGCAAVSPDGRTLAFGRRGSAGEWSFGLFAVDLAADLKPKGDIRPLVAKSAASALQFCSGLTWTPNGKSAVFSSAPGILAVAARSRNGNEPVKTPGLEGDWPTFARRSSRFMCDHSRGGDQDIWSLALNDRQEKAGEPVRLISSTRGEFAQSYSPDGRHIAFESDRGGNLEIWVCGSDGSNCSQLTALHSQYTGVPTWSPDGRQIAFYSRSGEKTHVYIVPAEGGAARRASSDEGDEFYPRWSRSGEWIYFASKRTGVYQLWKLRPSGGNPVQVTQGGGFAASESPAGRWLYFTHSESTDSGVWRMPLGGGTESEVIPSVNMHNFQVVENGIFYAGHSAQGVAIFFTDADGKSPKVVSTITPGYVGFSVSPDRRSLTYVSTNPAVSELLMAEQLPITGGR